MKKAIIYIPNKNPMQSGLAKNNRWILEFKTKDPTKNPLMGWESSSDTYTELKLEFSSKELAINYAKKKKIEYDKLSNIEKLLNIENKKLINENNSLSNKIDLNFLDEIYREKFVIGKKNEKLLIIK